MMRLMRVAVPVPVRSPLSSSLPSLSSSFSLIAPTAITRRAGYSTAAAATTSSSSSSGGLFKGGLLGFLLGLGISSASAYVYLLDEYQTSNNSLLASVEDLQKTTRQLRDYTKRIEILESQLASVTATTPTKPQLEAVKSDLLKLIDDANIQHLSLKTEVWDLKQTK